MKKLWKFKFSETRQASGSMDLDVTSPKLLNRKVFLKQLAVDLCTSERRMLFRAQYVSQCLVLLPFERFIKETRGISSNVSLLGRGSCPPYAATARLSLSDTSITHAHTQTRCLIWWSPHARLVCCCTRYWEGDWETSEAASWRLWIFSTVSGSCSTEVFSCCKQF